MIYSFMNSARPFIEAPKFAEEVAKNHPLDLQANAAEECCEVAQSICKLLRGKTSERGDLIYEMADALRLFQYLIVLHHISDEELIHALEEKLARDVDRYEKTGNPFLTSSQVREIEAEKKAKKKVEKKKKEEKVDSEPKPKKKKDSKEKKEKPEKKKSPKTKEEKPKKEKKEKKAVTSKKETTEER